MAKAEFTSGLGGLKGKVGGSVFAKNKGGFYMRTKVKPLNPKSAFQQKVRANFTEVSQAWGNLTDAQIKAWNIYAEQLSFAHKKKSFGGRQKYSGKTLFQLVNNNRKIIGLAQANTPPLKTELNASPVTNITITNSSSKVELNYTANPTEASYVTIWATPILSKGTRSYTGKYKQFGSQLLSTTTKKYDLSSQFTARFGSVPAAGSNVAFQVKQVTKEGYNGSTFEVTRVYA